MLDRYINQSGAPAGAFLFFAATGAREAVTTDTEEGKEMVPDATAAVHFPNRTISMANMVAN